MKTCKIDYLSFTIPFYERDSYLEYLGAELAWLGRGFRGYKEGAILSRGGMFGMTLGREESHFDLPGKAVDAYVDSYDKLVGLLDKIVKDGGNISRIDFAIDVVEEMAHKNIVKAVRSGMLVSKSRKVCIIEELDNKGRNPSVSGGTVYVGSRSSKKLLRIYDKAKEMGLPGEKVRWELQLRDDVALKAAVGFVESGIAGFPGYIHGLISGFVDFRKKDSDNVSRCSRVRWFDRFMSGIESIKIVFEKKIVTVSQLVEWVDKQVSPTLALFKRFYGDSFGSILDFLLLSGDNRLKSKHFEMLSPVVSV